MTDFSRSYGKIKKNEGWDQFLTIAKKFCLKWDKFLDDDSRAH